MTIRILMQLILYDNYLVENGVLCRHLRNYGSVDASYFQEVEIIESKPQGNVADPYASIGRDQKITGSTV